MHLSYLLDPANITSQELLDFRYPPSEGMGECEKITKQGLLSSGIAIIVKIIVFQVVFTVMLTKE